MADDTGHLVDRATHGDGDAVAELLARYLPDLETYVRRHAAASVRARESGTDLVQSVCREVLEHLDDERLVYRGEAEFRQWLYRAATLKLMNRHRYYTAGKRDVAREAPLGTSLAHRAALALATPSEDVALAEQIQRIEAAWARLRGNYQEIIALAYLEGLSHKEIASRLGITEANSRMLLSRALARLARLGAGPPGDT